MRVKPRLTRCFAAVAFAATLSPAAVTAQATTVADSVSATPAASSADTARTQTAVPPAVRGRVGCVIPPSRNYFKEASTRRAWLWGAGRGNVLDTYLTPLEYIGPDFALLHRTERRARRGNSRVTVLAEYTGHLAYLHSPTDDGKEWDGDLSAAGGWLYNWRPAARLRLCAGGMVEVFGGFTYNTRASNNPAQGRLGASLLAAALAEYTFPLFRREAKATLELSAPVAGVQFAPQYGQSYYEIFSLGHSGGTVHFTHPANAPSARLAALLEVPVLGARVTLGWLSDVRQSELGGLKRHAWRNTFMIGYTRSLCILR